MQFSEPAARTMLTDSEGLLWNTSLFSNCCLQGDSHELPAVHLGNNRFLFPLSAVVALTVLMCLMSVTTVLGNILVMVAFAVDKSLRNHSCYFLLNLAICDFFVGSISVPWNIPYVLTGRWTYGRAACKMWLVVDSAVCISSVYTILLITYDRFVSVTKAVSYSVQQRTSNQANKAFIQIGTAWITALLVSAPAIIFWDIVSGQSSLPEDTCNFEFNSSWHFLICLSLMDFYVPFISIVYLNFSIYFNIRKRNEKKLKELKLKKKDENAIIFFTQDGSQSLSNHLINSRSLMDAHKSCSTMFNSKASLVGKEGLKATVMKVISTKQTNPETIGQLRIGPQCIKLKKDIKIAKSLTVIVGVYFICWGPFTLLFLIRAICQGLCFNAYLYDVAWWMLWLNSSINPFLYPLCHKRFRRAFMKILYCKI